MAFGLSGVYQGTDDGRTAGMILELRCMMKRKRANEILAESFREVAEHRPIDKITIQEIVDNCGYSPATFYRQFRDKYDLIAWDYVHRTTTIIDKVGVDA